MHFLKYAVKERGLVRLYPNRAQMEYSQNCSKHNIILKARQLGITTYIAARFFIQTMTQPGTLTVQVAHTQESAEEIFRIVHRFWENLPEAMQRGALVTSRANVRQIAFPHLDSEYRVATAADPNAGRGMTIHNLHCSEVARWPRDGAETLASLRAAVPDGRGDCAGIHAEWCRRKFLRGMAARRRNRIRTHFFPWWYEESYQFTSFRLDVLILKKRSWSARQGLNEKQIAWRRDKSCATAWLGRPGVRRRSFSCFRLRENVYSILMRSIALSRIVESHSNRKTTDDC